MESSDGWTRHYDERYSTYYYSHPVHGSRWDDPSEGNLKPSTATTSNNTVGGGSSAAGLNAPPGYSPSQQDNSNQADDISQLKQALAARNSDREVAGETSTASSSSSNHISGEENAEAVKVKTADLGAERTVEYQQSGFIAVGGSADYYAGQQMQMQQQMYQQQQQASAASYNPYGYQAGYPIAVAPQPSYMTNASYQSQPPTDMAVLYSPITAQSAVPESSLQTGPVSEDDAYFARLPAGAKRVSYLPNNASNVPAGTSLGPSRLGQSPSGSGSNVQSSESPSKLATVPSDSTMIQNEDDAYFARLPQGAKRISYNTQPSSGDGKALPVPSGAGYGTNEPPKPQPVFPPQSQPVVPLSRRERRRTNDSGRRFCCCFRTRGGCCFVIISIVILILGGLGVAAYFLWPRVPSIDISEPYVAPNVTPLTVSGSLGSATTTTPFTLQLRLAVDVSVFSPNRITYVVNNIVFAGALLDIDGVTTIPNANVNGNVANVEFPPEKKVMFTMPLELMYSITSAQTVLMGGDKALNVFQTRCGAGGSGKLGLKYTVSVNLAILAWTGYKPSFAGTTSVPCSAIGWESVLASLSG
ncbi:hypothetical protein BJ741DRAFT_609618 [Chytriomyces cf. hyalinus JEL632]|nr:hypothetical protein BJ741DRAFT_609618 [Chytriomyces cf. hyalinus JEL632]